MRRFSSRRRWNTRNGLQRGCHDMFSSNLHLRIAHRRASSCETTTHAACGRNLAFLHTSVETPKRWDAFAIAMYLGSADGRSLFQSLRFRTGQARCRNSIHRCEMPEPQAIAGSGRLRCYMAGTRGGTGARSCGFGIGFANGTRHFVNCIEHQFGLILHDPVRAFICQHVTASRQTLRDG